MELLQRFHSYIFGDVLRLDKFGMVFNAQNAPVNVLVMPLRKSISSLCVFPQSAHEMRHFSSTAG
jgi:hypothetical protein